MIDLRNANRWRIPKVGFHNWNKDEQAKHCFQKLSFRRYWSGRLWFLTFRGYQLELDFRRCFLADMVFPNADKHDRKAVDDAVKQNSQDHAPEGSQ